MRIWKLTPADPSDPIWKKWTSKPVIVRADSEAEARRLAVAITNKGFPPLPPMRMPVNPWKGYKKKGDPAPPTACEDITAHAQEYSIDGRAEVLVHGEGF